MECVTCTVHTIHLFDYPTKMCRKVSTNQCKLKNRHHLINVEQIESTVHPSLMTIHSESCAYASYRLLSFIIHNLSTSIRPLFFIVDSMNSFHMTLFCIFRWKERKAAISARYIVCADFISFLVFIFFSLNVYCVMCICHTVPSSILRYKHQTTPPQQQQQQQIKRKAIFNGIISHNFHKVDVQKRHM